MKQLHHQIHEINFFKSFFFFKPHRKRKTLIISTASISTKNNKIEIKNKISDHTNYGRKIKHQLSKI